MLKKTLMTLCALFASVALAVPGPRPPQKPTPQPKPRPCVPCHNGEGTPCDADCYGLVFHP